MATTPDVTLTGTSFQDLYAASGIAVGTVVRLQNKSSQPILIQNILAQPTSNSTDGFVVPPLGFFDTTGTYLGLWAKGVGTVAIA